LEMEIVFVYALLDSITVVTVFEVSLVRGAG
jgi:hypothetical protein